MKKHILRGAFALFFIASLTTGIVHHFKKLPAKLSYAGGMHETDDIQFLYDLTYEDKLGNRQVEQEIFDEAWKVIEEAEDFVLIDMFLFNDYTDQDRNFPGLSGQLTEKLIAKRKAYPHMPIVFITDPINTGYYSYESAQLQALEENNIEVVITDLDRLHDSNKPYTSMWRILIKPLGYGKTGWLPNPFASDAPKMSLRSYLSIFNVKANHRKAIVSEKNAIILSANAHNESGFASNIGFKVSGNIIRDIVEAEQAVIDYSGGKTKIEPPKVEKSSGDMRVQYITEGEILKSLVSAIDEAEKDDRIWVGMFYIANRSVVDALEDASDRAVDIRLILDANKNAFGNNKAGLPNVPIANELQAHDNVSIRWYESGEDQYHTKLLFVEKVAEDIIIGGSANHTTRNLADLNLENNLKITAAKDSQVSQDMKTYFERLWGNKDGNFTSDYETNEDALTPMLRLTYWIQKLTGLTTY